MTPPISPTYWRPLLELISIPAGTVLIYDFLVLFCVSRAHLAVQIEDATSKCQQSFPGGSNWPIDSLHRSHQHDFTSESRTWLDVAKSICLTYLYPLCMVMLFVTGTRRVSIVSTIYVIGSFVFLWQGSDFFLRPIRSIVRWWNCLIGLVLSVIAGRLLMQVPSCVLAPNQPAVCWLVQMLGTHCWCQSTAPDAGADACADSLRMGAHRIEYDVICLGLLLLQQRLYASAYFVHVVNDTKAVAILSPYAVQLIESLQCKEIAMQTARDDDMVSKIRGKVDAMKTDQPGANPLARIPRTHFEAIHAGC